MRKPPLPGLKNLKALLDTEYRIGMRVIKTAVAVMVCMFLSMLFKNDNILQISAVSALVALRATQQDTLRISTQRMLGTVLGGILGMLTVLIGLVLPFYSEGLFVIIIPLVIIANLYLCNLLKIYDACVISCVVTIIVASQVNVELSVSDTLFFTLFRIRDTLIGVLISTALNSIPDFRGKSGKS